MGRHDAPGTLANPHLRRAVALLVLGAWLGLWWHLGQTVLRLGPHRWDDFHYGSVAFEGLFDAAIRNRFVHVWGLRLSFLLSSADRVGASVNYALTMVLGLIVAAAGLGHRVAGWRGGVLAAALLPLYPPVLKTLTTPLPDIPSALYAALALWAACIAADADGGRAEARRAVLAILTGALCFASIKSKETGAAVVPVVWWLLHSSPWGGRLLGYWVTGAVLGQCGLCLVDWNITGDAWVSLRPEHHHDYGKVLTTAPEFGPKRPDRMRHEWMELLLARDMQGFTLCAGLGVLLGFRRNRTLAALSLWASCALLFNAWVSWRYSGIDAVERYLSAIAVPTVVAMAALLVRLYDGSHSDAAADTGPYGSSGERDSWLYRAGVLLALWFAYKGIEAGLVTLFEQEPSYADGRSEYFLLPLLAPLFLFIAWTTRSAWVRRGALPIVVCAACLVVVPTTREYVKAARVELPSWRKLADYMEQHEIKALRRYALSSRRLHRVVVHWRLTSFADVGKFSQKSLRHLDKLPRRQLVVLRASDEKKARAAGLDKLLTLPRARRKYVVMRHPETR